MILPLEAPTGFQDKKKFQRKTTHGDTYSLQKPPAIEYFQCILAEIQPTLAFIQDDKVHKKINHIRNIYKIK